VRGEIRIRASPTVHSCMCRMQEERTEVIEKMLQQREVDHYALNSKRMEHFWYCTMSAVTHILTDT
jgi:hypothetical protein